MTPVTVAMAGFRVSGQTSYTADLTVPTALKVGVRQTGSTSSRVAIKGHVTPDPCVVVMWCGFAFCVRC